MTIPIRSRLGPSLVAIALATAVACGDDDLAPLSPDQGDVGDGDGSPQKEDDPLADASSDVLPDAPPVDTLDVAEVAAPDTVAADAAPDALPDAADPDGPPPLPEPIMDGLVRGVDPIFWRNMDDFVFGHVRPSNVRLYVAVLNANHFAQRPHRAYGAELIRHPESYFANVLAPFVERYADALWAIDCLNEPEAIVQGPDGNYADWGVTWDEMRAYLAACAEVVHTYGGGLVPVSAGSGWHDWHNLEKGYYDGLGLDFLDAHVYLDTWDLPPASSLASIPVIIGECGQKTETWDDALQLAATRACFAQAAEGGYRAALSWYYDYAGSQNHLAHKNPDGSWRPVGALFSEYAGARPGFQTGLNLAWLEGAYDHDFAPNPLHPSWGVAYDSAVAGAVVADYAATGIEVMRLWAFEGQEGLPFSAIHADFERDLGGFSAIDRATTSLASSTAAALDANGARGLRVTFATGGAGWQGIERAFPADMPLNLAHVSTWRLTARHELGRAIGVNLYFVLEREGASGPELVTYQTTRDGQLWLAPGTTATHEVTLSAAGFQADWALASAPEVGAARPADAELERVRAIGVRVYFAGAESGTLDLDLIAIR